MPATQDDEKNMDSTHLEMLPRGTGTGGDVGHVGLGLHDEVTAKDVTAEGLADDMLHVDDARAEELRRELASNKQGGWRAETAEEKRINAKLNLKLDLFILPLLALGYMFNQLDRTNIGNAQTSGFSTDLHMPSTAVNNASSIFYATYVPFQPIVAAIGRRIGAHRFMGLTLVLWGILTICHAFIKNEAQLIAVRLLMGLAECGFYPSVLAYLTEFYPRYECGFRFALFYGFSSVAGAFGGLIAYGILQAHGALYSWQYLFLIEGAVPVLLGLAVPFWLAGDIKSAWYLSDAEKSFAEKRMIVDSAANYGRGHNVTRRDFKEAFLDWRVWSIMISNTLASLSSQGFTVFFPVVVAGLGYKGVLANLMTVPPYVAGAIGVWLFSWSSDRFKERTFHLLGGMTLVIIGLILTIVIPLNNVHGRYAGLMVLMFGAFIHSPVAVAWLAGNTPEPGKRVIVIGISGWANLAGIIGTQLFQSKFGPGYIYPLQVTVGLMAVGWAGFAATAVALRLINRSRLKKIQRMTPAEIEEENRSDVRVGDKKYTFVYGL